MPLIRRRRPLLRAAAVGGAAYAAGKRHAQNENQPFAEEPAPAAPAGSGGMSSASMERLKAVADLHDRGILTDAEFEDQKRALLSGGA